MAADPSHGDVHSVEFTQAEVQAAIVHGEVARLRGYFLRLLFAAVAGDHARADRASVRLRADQLHFDPMARLVALPHVVTEEGWRLIHVHDEYVDIAVVVEIAEGAAAAGMRRRYA